MITIGSVNEHGASRNVYIDKSPEDCPICKRKISPKLYSGYSGSNNILQVIFRCPAQECQNIFIGYYRADNEKNQAIYYFFNSKPSEMANREFSEIICNISVNFRDIFNQSFIAEQYKLEHVCGAGYRKALEFLVKDYLIDMNPDDSEAIKKEFLGICIENRIINENIKSVAKRAAWLGNDEIHYEKRWEGKDVQDLKILIELVIRWIETEKLTNDILKDMA